MQAQLAFLASRPRHCPDVDKLMEEMVTAVAASTQAFAPIGEMEGVLRRRFQIKQVGLQLRPW